MSRARGVLIRDRNIDPTALVWSRPLGFAIGNDRANRELRHAYIRFGDQFIHPSSVHDWLTAERVDHLREVVEYAMWSRTAVLSDR